VTVDLAGGTATVDYDGEAATLAQVKAAIEDQGYDV
jgi:copper chaperone CopZ